MNKRVTFFIDYLIEDVDTDEEALEIASARLNEDMNNGYFCLEEMVEDEAEE